MLIGAMKALSMDATQLGAAKNAVNLCASLARISNSATPLVPVRKPNVDGSIMFALGVSILGMSADLAVHGYDSAVSSDVVLVLNGSLMPFSALVLNFMLVAAATGNAKNAAEWASGCDSRAALDTDAEGCSIDVVLGSSKKH
jgi:hypothetical protein